MKGPFPTLSLRERDRRWRRTKDLMMINGVQCLIVAGFKGREQFEGYLSNDYAEGVVIFPLDGNPVHLTWTGTRLTRHLESDLCGSTPWISDMRVGCSGPAITNVIKEKGFENNRIGVVGLTSRAPGEKDGIFPYNTWSYVHANLSRVTFVELSEDFAEMVLVKSQEELDLVRFSAGIGEHACRKMVEMVKPGVNERELYAEIMGVIFKYGASSPAPFLILHSGKENLSWGPPLWTYQGGSGRSIENGDLVLAEIFPRYGGMESQQQMTIHLKPTNQTALDCALAARRAYEVGLATLRPGIAFHEVYSAMENPILDADCWYLTPLIHSLSPMGWTGKTGGVGIKADSQMQWLSEIMHPRKATGGSLIIKPGMVFELEPNACKGKLRINIGGTVVVTDSGVEELNKISTNIQIAG